MAPRLYSGGIAVRCLKLTTKGQAPYWLGFSLSMPKPKLLRSPFTSPTTGTRLQVGLRPTEHRVVGRAVLASALLPALPLMADHPGRHDVLPFDPLGPLGLFAGNVAAAGEIDAVALNWQP